MMGNVAVRYAVVRELESRLAEAKTALNEHFLELLEPGDAKAARLDDGTKLGKISVTEGRVSLTVANEQEFLQWVKANHPEEIVETVRPAFQRLVLDRAKQDGELPPGVDVKQGNPFVSFRAEKGAGEVIGERWRELVMDVVAIEAQDAEQ